MNEVWDPIVNRLADFFGGVADQYRSIEQWVARHDQTIDIVTVYLFAVGFALLAIVELLTWAAMIGQEDRSKLGTVLRKKKVAYVLICSAMALLYGMTLYGYHQAYNFGFRPRFGLRLLGMTGIILAVFFGVWFITLLLRQRWMVINKGDNLDDRAKQLDYRGAEQDRRGAEQDRRDLAIERRE